MRRRSPQQIRREQRETEERLRKSREEFNAGYTYQLGERVRFQSLHENARDCMEWHDFIRESVASRL